MSNRIHHIMSPLLLAFLTLLSGAKGLLHFSVFLVVFFPVLAISRLFLLFYLMWCSSCNPPT